VDPESDHVTVAGALIEKGRKENMEAESEPVRVLNNSLPLNELQK
jgi:hypothetical protein